MKCEEWESTTCCSSCCSKVKVGGWGGGRRAEKESGLQKDAREVGWVKQKDDFALVSLAHINLGDWTVSIRSHPL